MSRHSGLVFFEPTQANRFYIIENYFSYLRNVQYLWKISNKGGIKFFLSIIFRYTVPQIQQVISQYALQYVKPARGPLLRNASAVYSRSHSSQLCLHNMFCIFAIPGPSDIIMNLKDPSSVALISEEEAHDSLRKKWIAAVRRKNFILLL